MDIFSFLISLATVATSCAVSIVTVRHQTKINEDNNKRLLEAEKLNNENQLKLKRLDHYYAEKSLAVSQYLDDLFDYLDEPSEICLLHYRKSMAKVSMYVSSKVYDEISFINALINENKIEKIQKDHIEFLIDSLCTDSQQYE